jgi:TfoX/Sxy family transcriptional regulator of competence genes
MKMAKEYFEKLSNLISELSIEDETAAPLEVKHFFSGAALYVDGTIRATWSPVGMAFKLGESEANQLINNGKAIPLKYFPNGHVKKDYALFENPSMSEPSPWKEYFIKSIRKS